MSMSQPEDTDLDDISKEPFLDESERMESEWLFARMNDPLASPSSPEIVNAYARIEVLLGQLPVGNLDAHWREQILVKVASLAKPLRPRRRPGTVRWAVPVALALAAAIVIGLLVFPRAIPELYVAIRHDGTTRAAGQVAVAGDHLVVRARHSKPGELRVYRADGALVARCPGGPGCSSSTESEFALDILLDAPVPHHVIFVEGVVGIPIAATMEIYIDAARTANAHVVTYGPIDVH
jgi:hypothetical protein